MTTQETSQDRFKNARSQFMNGMIENSNSGKFVIFDFDKTIINQNMDNYFYSLWRRSDYGSGKADAVTAENIENFFKIQDSGIKNEKQLKPALQSALTDGMEVAIASFTRYRKAVEYVVQNYLGLSEEQAKNIKVVGGLPEKDIRSKVGKNLHILDLLKTYKKKHGRLPQEVMLVDDSKENVDRVNDFHNNIGVLLAQDKKIAKTEITAGELKSITFTGVKVPREAITETNTTADDGYLDVVKKWVDAERNVHYEPLTGSKKFKHEVKQSGNLHLGWNIPTGNGLNELNATKKADPAATKPHIGMKLAHVLNPLKTLRERSNSVSSPSSISSQPTTPLTQADIDRTMMESINAFEQNPNVQSRSTPVVIEEFPELPECAKAPALFPKPSKEKIQEALDKARCKSSSSASVQASSPLKHNPIYQNTELVTPKRFKLRPFLCSDIDGYVAPDKRNPNLEKCSITRNGSKTEPEMKRNHEFKEDLTIKHVKAPVAICPTTRGNGAKRISKPDVSWIQKPQSKVEGVKVDDAAKKVSRLIAQFEQGGRG